MAQATDARVAEQFKAAEAAWRVAVAALAAAGKDKDAAANEGKLRSDLINAETAHYARKLLTHRDRVIASLQARMAAAA